MRLWCVICRSDPSLGYKSTDFTRGMESFGSIGHVDAFQSVCKGHRHVLPTETFHHLRDSKDQLRLIAELQQKAMSLRTEVARHRAAATVLRKREEELQALNSELLQAKQAAE